MVTEINLTKNEWFPSPEMAICYGEIKTFATIREAETMAMEYGWGRRILRVRRRFETVYCVGVLDFIPDSEGGIEFDTLRMPLLRYETGEDGIKYQPVVTFCRARKDKSE